METLVIVVHVIAAIAIIGLVLLQQGKGAETGAAFGSGASQTVFGSGGSGNFLTRSTSLAAVVFFATSLVLAVFAKQYSVGATDGAAPIVNPDLLQEQLQSDIPQVSAPEADAASDIPQVGSSADSESVAE
jgi:preprotein translocase subunit SecG